MTRHKKIKFKKKICIFDSYFPFMQGGAEYQSYLIANLLKKEKFDIFFLSFDHSKKDLITQDGYKIYSINTKKCIPKSKFGKSYFVYYFRIKKILLKERPDIIFRRMGTAVPGILCMLKRKLNYKLIWSCAHINDLKILNIHSLKNIFNYIDDLFRIYGIKNADKVLVQTNEQMKILKESFNKNSTLFRNMHPINNYKIRKNNTLIRILWVANFKKWKQPEVFIELAFKFLNYKNVRFIMVGRQGDGRFWRNLQNTIENCKIIQHMGELPIEDVNNMMSESHILINTSLYEGFPNTFIQAWMRKVPVISLNVNPDEIISKNKIGFHSKSFEQLIEDTKILIENKALREEMGERARTFAMEMFSINNIKILVDMIESEE